MQCMDSKHIETFYKSSDKPVMNALYFVNRFIYFINVLFVYFFSLMRGKKLLKSMKTQIILNIDYNTKMANILIVFVILFSIIMGSISTTAVVYEFSFSEKSQLNIALYGILTMTTFTFLMVGNGLIPFIYFYINWTISSLINNLTNNLSEGKFII